jgi:hypothetical protein
MRVQANRLYIYHANLLDRCDARTNLQDGDTVRVVNLQGCPPCNTAQHAHVVNLDGHFVGLVHTNSLHTRADYIKYLRERIATHSDNPRNQSAITSKLQESK